MTGEGLAVAPWIWVDALGREVRDSRLAAFRQWAVTLDGKRVGFVALPLDGEHDAALAAAESMLAAS